MLLHEIWSVNFFKFWHFCIPVLDKKYWCGLVLNVEENVLRGTWHLLFFFFWSDVLEHITNRKEDLFFYLFPGISNALHSHLCVLIYFVFLLLTPTTCLWLVELRLAWVAYILLLNHAVSSVREPFICFGISSSSFSFTPKCKWFLLVIPCYLGLDKMLCLQGLWSCN